MTSSEDDVRQLPLRLLAQRCQEEHASYLRREAHPPIFAYELFRRAFGTEDEAALPELITIYKPLLVSHIKNHSKFAQTSEQAEDIFYEALGNMCMAFAKKRAAALHEEWFTEQFPIPHVGTLINYFKMCVFTVIKLFLLH